MSVVQGDSAAVCPSAARALSYDVNLQAHPSPLLHIIKTLSSQLHFRKAPGPGWTWQTLKWQETVQIVS